MYCAHTHAQINAASVVHVSRIGILFQILNGFRCIAFFHPRPPTPSSLSPTIFIIISNWLRVDNALRNVVNLNEVRIAFYCNVNCEWECVCVCCGMWIVQCALYSSVMQQFFAAGAAVLIYFWMFCVYSTWMGKQQAFIV